MTKRKNIKIEEMSDNLEFIDYKSEEKKNDFTPKHPGRTATIRYTVIDTATNRAIMTGTANEFTDKYFKYSSKKDVKGARQAIRYSARTGKAVFGGKIIAYVNEE